MKKSKLETEKNQYLNKSKTNTYNKYIVTKRCSEERELL